MNCLREFGKMMPNTDCGDSDWSPTANVGGRLNAALTVHYKPSVVPNILLASHFQTKFFWCLQDLTKVSRHPSSRSDRCDQLIADTQEADDAAQRVKKKYSVSKRSRPPHRLGAAQAGDTLVVVSALPCDGVFHSGQSCVVSCSRGSRPQQALQGSLSAAWSYRNHLW